MMDMKLKFDSKKIDNYYSQQQQNIIQMNRWNDIYLYRGWKL